MKTPGSVRLHTTPVVDDDKHQTEFRKLRSISDHRIQKTAPLPQQPSSSSNYTTMTHFTTPDTPPDPPCV